MKKFKSTDKKLLATVLLGGLSLMGTSAWAASAQENGNGVENAANHVGSVPNWST